MTNLLFLILVFLVGLTPEVQARTLSAACDRLAKGDGEETKKCITHSNLFDLSRQFVDACTDFHSDTDIRKRCLRSGADLKILKICKNTGWSLNSVLSCLRSYPNEDSMKACREISTDEKEQLKCIRIGRSASQVHACIELGPDQRLRCLELDISTLEARHCKKKSAAQKMPCLEDVVAQREGVNRSDQRELRGRKLASDPEPTKP